MKELSIEQKAKAYDEAIEKLHEIITMDNKPVNPKEIGEYLFPKFKESKNNKDKCMLNNIIDTLRPLSGTTHSGYAINSMIAWLEKQGNLMKALQISNARIGELIEKNYYLKEQLEKQGNNMGISEATKKKLEDNLNKALEKETPESWNKFLDEQGSKEENLKEHNICDTCEDSNGCLIPCCAKLLEKQGEQKMITPEESLGIDSDTYNKIVDECVYGEQKLTDKIESRQEELTEFEKAVKQVMEEAIECGDTHNLKADADMLLRLVQKPAWSEEDIELLDNTIKFIEDRVAATSPSLRTYSTTLTGKEIPFLKSLKDRYAWKPSDEQMKGIECTIKTLRYQLNAGDNRLDSLYNDLKKLRKE